MKFGRIARCVGFVCVRVNLCSILLSDLQTRFVPASWAVCPCLVWDHNKQPWLVIGQYQGLNARLEFSSAGRDGHGSRVKAFEAPQHMKRRV